MDVLTAIANASGLLAIPIAAGVALVVGRRRGLDKAEAEGDAVTRQLVSDLKDRVAILERERAEDRAKIVVLEAKVQTLQTERDVLDAAIRRAGSKA